MGVGAGLYMYDVVGKKVHVHYLISWWVLVLFCQNRSTYHQTSHSSIVLVFSHNTSWQIPTRSLFAERDMIGLQVGDMKASRFRPTYVENDTAA